MAARLRTAASLLRSRRSSSLHLLPRTFSAPSYAKSAAAAAASAVPKSAAAAAYAKSAAAKDPRAVASTKEPRAAASAKDPPAAASAAPRSTLNNEKPEDRLNSIFWSKPCSLALPPNSPLRVEEPKYEGIRLFILKLMLFYSKQSKSIRGANVVYHRIVSQVDKPAIYGVFHLEKTFKTTFSLLVLHTWLLLRRLKEEGKEGAEFGQYVYEIYNHDVELRVSKAGVNLLLIKWMKELEKIFYGNVVAYDSALTPEAKHTDLVNAIWRNIFSDDGSELPNDSTATAAVKAMARYARRESTNLSLTAKEAIYSGNFTFTPLECHAPSQLKPTDQH